MLKMLKIGCLKQKHSIWSMPQGIPMEIFGQQLWSPVFVTSFTHIHSGLQQSLFL